MSHIHLDVLFIYVAEYIISKRVSHCGGGIHQSQTFPSTEGAGPLAQLVSSSRTSEVGSSAFHSDCVLKT